MDVATKKQVSVNISIGRVKLAIAQLAQKKFFFVHTEREQEGEDRRPTGNCS